MRFLKSNFLARLINSYMVDSPQPVNISYLWNFGSLLGVCLILQIITGIFLAMHYQAHVDFAFNSVEHIMRDVNNGWAVRYTHANVASFFFIFVYAHIGRGLYYGSYRTPRVAVWTIGVIILILMMAIGFLGCTKIVSALCVLFSKDYSIFNVLHYLSTNNVILIWFSDSFSKNFKFISQMLPPSKRKQTKALDLMKKLILIVFLPLFFQVYLLGNIYDNIFLIENTFSSISPFFVNNFCFFRLTYLTLILFFLIYAICTNNSRYNWLILFIMCLTVFSIMFYIWPVLVWVLNGNYLFNYNFVEVPQSELYFIIQMILLILRPYSTYYFFKLHWEKEHYFSSLLCFILGVLPFFLIIPGIKEIMNHLLGLGFNSLEKDKTSLPFGEGVGVVSDNCSNFEENKIINGLVKAPFLKEILGIFFQYYELKKSVYPLEDLNIKNNKVILFTPLSKPAIVQAYNFKCELERQEDFVRANKIKFILFKSWIKGIYMNYKFQNKPPVFSDQISLNTTKNDLVQEILFTPKDSLVRGKFNPFTQGEGPALPTMDPIVVFMASSANTSNQEGLTTIDGFSDTEEDNTWPNEDQFAEPLGNPLGNPFGAPADPEANNFLNGIMLNLGTFEGVNLPLNGGLPGMPNDLNHILIDMQTALSAQDEAEVILLIGSLIHNLPNNMIEPIISELLHSSAPELFRRDVIFEILRFITTDNGLFIENAIEIFLTEEINYYRQIFPQPHVFPFVAEDSFEPVEEYLGALPHPIIVDMPDVHDAMSFEVSINNNLVFDFHIQDYFDWIQNAKNQSLGNLIFNLNIMGHSFWESYEDRVTHYRENTLFKGYWSYAKTLQEFRQYNNEFYLANIHTIFRFQVLILTELYLLNEWDRFNIDPRRSLILSLKHSYEIFQLTEHLHGIWAE